MTSTRWMPRQLAKGWWQAPCRTLWCTLTEKEGFQFDTSIQLEINVRDVSVLDKLFLDLIPCTLIRLHIDIHRSLVHSSCLQHSKPSLFLSRLVRLISRIYDAPKMSAFVLSLSILACEARRPDYKRAQVPFERILLPGPLISLYQRQQSTPRVVMNSFAECQQTNDTCITNQAGAL